MSDPFEVTNLSHGARLMVLHLSASPGGSADVWKFRERCLGSRAQIGTWYKTIIRRGLVVEADNTVTLTQSGRDLAAYLKERQSVRREIARHDEAYRRGDIR